MKSRTNGVTVKDNMIDDGNKSNDPSQARTPIISDKPPIPTILVNAPSIPSNVVEDSPNDVPSLPRHNPTGQASDIRQVHGKETTKIKRELRLSLMQSSNAQPARKFTHVNLVAELLKEETIARLIQENGWRRAGTTMPLRFSDFKPDDDHDYIPTLAILLLIDREEDIADFMEEQISAAVLPLHASVVDCETSFYRRDSQGGRGALAELRSLTMEQARENFRERQHQVMAPRFTINMATADKFEAIHMTLDRDTILPWCQVMASGTASLDLRVAIESGFAVVQQVRMDPRSHDFDMVLQKLRLRCDGFALKTLKNINNHADPKLFQNELEQLKRFNAFRNPHLVMLLASFQLGDEYHFLFPYAKCNLSDFWEKPPQRDTSSTRWLARQLLGLAEALSVIHAPSWERGRFGRHGDIKAENILIFERKSIEKDGIDEEIMVLTDLGLTDIHSEFSRSNIPTKNLPMTPTYRAPESDFKADGINRAFDIWTLGCLLMEAMVWYLGGPGWLQMFTADRTSPDVRHLCTPIYFDIMYTTGDEHPEDKPTYTASVKSKVTEWFNKIRTHENCTQLVIDIIDIVEKYMLIIRTPKQDRITAQTLTSRFKTIQDRCEREDYIRKPVQDPRPPMTPVLVRVELKPGIVDDHRSGMLAMPRRFDGRRTHQGLSQLELEKS